MFANSYASFVALSGVQAKQPGPRELSIAPPDQLR
jgi:hypothetical protein